MILSLYRQLHTLSTFNNSEIRGRNETRTLAGVSCKQNTSTGWHLLNYVYHSVVAWKWSYCCKGDQLRQNWQCQNSETSHLIDTYFGDIIPHAKIQSDHPSGGIPANRPSRMVFSLFLFVTSIFAHMTSILGYCIPWWIKLQNVSVYPIFITPINFLKRGVNRHFKPTRISLKLIYRQNYIADSTKFCTVLKITRYSLWVVPSVHIINPRWRTAVIWTGSSVTADGQSNVICQ